MSAKSETFTILLTSAQEDAEYFFELVEDEEIKIIHLPLEKYVPVEPEKDELEERLEPAENIIHGHKRNARFFMDKVREYELQEMVTDRVNLAGDPLTADFLEEHGVLAIYPGSKEPIKMLEFLMRLRRLGTVFYPCGTHKNEEIPGLLTELDIEVREQVFYELDGPTDEELESFRSKVEETHFDGLIYHSRRAVNRIQAAFPRLHEAGVAIIAGDQAVSDKLKNDHAIETDRTAGGSWQSIFEQVKELR